MSISHEALFKIALNLEDLVITSMDFNVKESNSISMWTSKTGSKFPFERNARNQAVVCMIELEELGVI